MENNIPICRVCMQKSPEFLDFDMPLQNENEEDTSISYLDFFFECTRIEVEPHEGGSQCFCLPCADELRSFYKFVRIAEMTDRILKERQLIQNKKSTKNDSTYKMTTCEPQFENNLTLDDKLLHETCDGISANLDECLSQYQSLNLKSRAHCNIKRNHKLVDLRVEVFSDRKLTFDGDSLSDITKNNLKNNPNIIICKDSSEEVNAQSVELNQRKSLKGAIYKKGKSGPVECVFCHEILKNRKRLDEHLVEEHQRRTIPCEICGKMVIRMRDHLLIHFREKNEISRPKIECPICFRKVSKQTISRHIRYVHKRQDKKQSCPHCLQTFADAHKLKVHLTKGHTTNRSYKCPLCTGLFSSTTSISNHLRTHSCLERTNQKI